MVDVDWSKAPEDATHYDCREYVSPAFMRKNHNGCDWEFFGDGHWIIYGQLSADQAEKLIAKPDAWSGDGLPPVGTVCEFRVYDDDWRQCEVVAHKAETAVCWIHCNKILSTGGASVRPIRTPEQIAQQERQAAIEEMDAVFSSNFEGHLKDGLQALYDAGYRKFEITDES